MHKNLLDVFRACSSEGMFIPLDGIAYEQIKAMTLVASVDLETVNAWKQRAPKESGQWNAIFKLSYDVLHTLTEAFLLFDKAKAKTHECLFAYLCERHRELKFDWSFLEKIRTTRNRSIYYGRPVSYNEWKEVESPIDQHITVLKKSIESKLKKKEE